MVDVLFSPHDDSMGKIPKKGLQAGSSTDQEFWGGEGILGGYGYIFVFQGLCNAEML